LEKEYSVKNSLFLWGGKIPQKKKKNPKKSKSKFKKSPQLQLWKQEYFSPCQYFKQISEIFSFGGLAYYQGP